MATETIILSLKEGTTELIFTDNEGHKGSDITTDVSPGDKVIWKISNGSKISEICKVYRNAHSNDIFSQDPESQGSSGNWVGVVGNSTSGKETYGIKYKIGSSEYDADPVLRVKPAP